MSVSVEKIPGGFRIDGLELKGGKCGCTSILPCCHSWSKIKRNGDIFIFSAKTSSPETRDIFFWSYEVKKNGFVVTVTMEDASDKTIFSGYYPPTLEDWIEKGWQVVKKDGSREDFGLWRCATCKWLYKEKEEGRLFADLGDEWSCPVCGAGRNVFERVG